MNPLLKDLLEHLELEPLEVNLFRGTSKDIGSPQVFGGQVLGQALRAASSMASTVASSASRIEAWRLRNSRAGTSTS